MPRQLYNSTCTTVAVHPQLYDLKPLKTSRVGHGKFTIGRSLQFISLENFKHGGCKQEVNDIFGDVSELLEAYERSKREKAGEEVDDEDLAAPEEDDDDAAETYQAQLARPLSWLPTGFEFLFVCPFCWLVGGLVGWFVGWLVTWMVYWLVGGGLVGCEGERERAGER